jgi:hypothetical protein
MDIFINRSWKKQRNNDIKRTATSKEAGEKQKEATNYEENGPHGLWGTKHSGKLCQIPPPIRMPCPERVI